MTAVTSPRPVDVRLKPTERRQLASLLQGTLPVRVQQRAQALRLLDQGWSCQKTAEAVNYRRNAVYEIARRWEDGGLERALYDLPRGIPEPRLDAAEEARVVAMVCGPPPEGRARWSVRLIVEQAIERKLVPTVGRETVRVLLQRHELKPWRETNVVRASRDRGVRGEDGGRAGDAREAARPAAARRRAR